MQFFQASLLNTEKKKKTDSEMGGENEAEKVKRNFYSVRWFFIFHSHVKNTQTFKLFSLPPVPLPRIPPRPDTRGQPTAMQNSIAFPEQHFTHIFYFKALLKFPRLPLVLLHYSLYIAVQHEGPSERLAEQASTKQVLFDIIKSTEVGL